MDLDPVRGREQGKDRPSVVVSSAFHLRLTRGALAIVLPVTSVERAGWLHRIPIGSGSWVITEQVRTVSVRRFRRPDPEITLTEAQLAHIREVLTRMLF